MRTDREDECEVMSHQEKEIDGNSLVAFFMDFYSCMPMSLTTNFFFRKNPIDFMALEPHPLGLGPLLTRLVQIGVRGSGPVFLILDLLIDWVHGDIMSRVRKSNPAVFPTE